MATQTSRLPNRRNFGQERREGKHDNWMAHNVLVEEVNRLKHLLSMETAKFMDADSKVHQLSRDLQETRLQVEKQKSLKEMFINQGKDKKRELETMQKYTDAETLSTAKIASQVQSTIKHKKKKLLQKDYEELQVAHVVIQQKFSSEIQREKGKSQALQQELDTTLNLHQELKVKYESDVRAARQHAETLQHQLQIETKSHEEKALKDQQLINDLRAELDALHQQMEHEKAVLQQTLKETEMQFKVELEQMKVSYEELSLKYESDVEASKLEAETLKRELKREMKSHAEKVQQHQELINNLRAELDTLHQPMEQETAVLQQVQLPEEIVSETGDLPVPEPTEQDQVSEEPLPETRTKTPSLLKRIRRSLGLRKPQRWKKENTT